MKLFRTELEQVSYLFIVITVLQSSHRVSPRCLLYLDFFFLNCIGQEQSNAKQELKYYFDKNI